MGIKKVVKIGGKDVEVRTLTFGDMLKISSPKIGLNEMIWQTLTQADQNYLEELEFTPELNKDYENMIKMFLEVNPALTNEKARDFLPTKNEKTSGGSNSGLPASSDGQSSKSTT